MFNVQSDTCRNTALHSYQKWKIGNDVRQILMNDTDVKALVGNKIFPLVAPENTVGDFIIYQREKYSKAWAKQGVYEDSCQLAVTIVTDNYDRAIDLAQKVDLALTGEHTFDDVTVQMDLADSTESFEDLKYIEVLLFNVK